MALNHPINIFLYLIFTVFNSHSSVFVSWGFCIWMYITQLYLRITVYVPTSKLLLKHSFKKLYHVSVCLCMCGQVPNGTRREQTHGTGLTGGYEWPDVELETELWLCARAGRDLHGWAVSPTLKRIFTRLFHHTSYNFHLIPTSFFHPYALLFLS